MVINQQTAAQSKVEELFAALSRRKGTYSVGECPVNITSAFIEVCLAQSCGKCIPCRVGLDRLNALLEKVLSRQASLEDLDAIEECAHAIYDSADCAIGFESAKLVLDGIHTFRDDYESHTLHGTCTENFKSVPCVHGCPANVDIPGYIALIKEGRYADAVRLIRKDNPFPTVCGLVCEHPCETQCRRNIVDASINIRALKRYACENAGKVPAPSCAPSNGKKVAIIGGGPSGLTAAYFLQLKGYQTTIFEMRNELGGMLRYGIPPYRLPDEELDKDISAILSTGLEVKYGVEIGKDISFDEIKNQFDCVYISIGASSGKALGVEGEDAEGVLSAVDFLRDVNNGSAPDFTGKRIVIVGGGNVAMDATRAAKRLNPVSVVTAYRRRIEDMTADPAEVEGAIAECCEIMPLMAPVRILVEDGKCAGLVCKPQNAGPVEGGRPKPVDSALDEVSLKADIVLVAIGQDINSEFLEAAGIETKRKRVVASDRGEVPNMQGIFTGGDAYFGPSTAIKAVAAGKIAAGNIDKYCGLHTPISVDFDIPPASSLGKPAWGKVMLKERPAEERNKDFDIMEYRITDEEAQLECDRCLRCDHFGYGSFRGGRTYKW